MHRSTFLFSLCVSHNNNGHQCQLLANRFAYSRFQAYLHASTSRFLSRKKATISFLVTRLDRIIMGLLHCIRNQLQGTYLHIIISHALLRDTAGLTPHPPSTWRFLGFLFDFLLRWIFHSVSSHEFSLPLSQQEIHPNIQGGSPKIAQFSNFVISACLILLFVQLGIFYGV